MDNGHKEFPHLSEKLAGLSELANNLWWSWQPAARMLFKMLDRQAWKESGHNPVMMLRKLSREAFEAAANDPEYLRHYDLVLALFRRDMDPTEGRFIGGAIGPKHFMCA
jgi:starch phosphorylase